MDKTFKLSEVNLAIKDLLRDVFLEGFWLVAEVSECRVASNGHCYLELVEKDELQGIVARQKAIIWASQYAMLLPYFHSVMQSRITEGMQIMVFAKVEFHEVYGMSLNITDINPEYTLGRIVSEKNRIIQRLSEEGVLMMNRELLFPTLPRRIAVISSRSAAGAEDFIHQLQNNPCGYGFSVELFDAKMQGKEVETSVISALDRIFCRSDEFDVVVIIRGGGSSADLDCFNSYEIAMNITQFPLPVLCGIGHQRDETVIDTVSYRSLKTPTAVAEFLIGCFDEQVGFIRELSERIVRASQDIVSDKEERLQKLSYELVYYSKNSIKESAQALDNKSFMIRSLARQRVVSAETVLDNQYADLQRLLRHFLQSEFRRLLLAEKSVFLLSPESVLLKGYTLVRQRGKVVKTLSDFRAGEKLEIQFADGIIELNLGEDVVCQKNL